MVRSCFSKKGNGNSTKGMSRSFKSSCGASYAVEGMMLRHELQYHRSVVNDG